MNTVISRDACLALDQTDPLGVLRTFFHLPDQSQGRIYLDGNSLGALPKATPAAVAQVIGQEWGQDLIQSWNKAGWFNMPQRLGDQLAPLIGAGPGEVVMTDTTSVNLYKVLCAAAELAHQRSPKKKVLLTEKCNFPTDLYIAKSVCNQYKLQLMLVEPSAVMEALTEDVALVMLTHVNYRTGAMYEMSQINQLARTVGALTVWDLAHSAGAVPIDLHQTNADYAIGCGYKYLNGGPGAPAFVWVNPRVLGATTQPLSGWWGHAQPFAFETSYEPKPGIDQYLCGTQSILALSAMRCGLDIFDHAKSLGGMTAIRKKSLELTDLFMKLCAARCESFGLKNVTPTDPRHRGSHVSLAVDDGGYAMMQALIARGVIGDFRRGDAAGEPDLLRFGFTPLYTRFVDVWDAVQQLVETLQSAEWQRPEFNQVQAVT
jgi:kynureninase